MLLYPNPAGKQITLEFAMPDGINEAKAEIFTTAFRKIKIIPVKRTGASAVMKLEIEIPGNYSNGVYYLWLDCGRRKTAKKFIVLK